MSKDHRKRNKKWGDCPTRKGKGIDTVKKQEQARLEGKYCYGSHSQQVRIGVAYNLPYYTIEQATYEHPNTIDKRCLLINYRMAKRKHRMNKKNS